MLQHKGTPLLETPPLILRKFTIQSTFLCAFSRFFMKALFDGEVISIHA